MKFYTFCIAVFLLSFTFKVDESCNCDKAETFISGKVALFGNHDSICLEGKNLEIVVLSTYYGKFHQSNEAMKYFLCKTSNTNQIILLMSPEIHYAIIKSQISDELMLLVISSFISELLKNSYVYRGKYFQYDLECFHQTRTNINDVESNIKNTLNAVVFKISEHTLSCIWFKNANDANIIIQYNNVDLTISLIQSRKQNSYFHQKVYACVGAMMNLKDIDVVVDQDVLLLSSEQRHFCLNEEDHTIETIRRKYRHNSDSKWYEYCSFKDKHSRYCIYLAEDFEYALISTSTHLGSKLVISHNAYQNFVIDPASTANTVNVQIDSIVCGKPKFQFTNEIWNLFASTRKTENEYCVIPSLLNGYFYANYTVESRTKELVFNGCRTNNNNVEITYANIIKVEESVSTILLPEGDNIIRYVSAPSFNHDIYTYHETKICGVRSAFGIYYSISSELNYALIINEYNHKTKLVYRNGIINEECSEDYFYDRIYFKSEVVCFPYQLVDARFRTQGYFYNQHYGDKIMFIVDLMNSNIEIDLNHRDDMKFSSQSKCHWKEITFDITRTRRHIDKTNCENMYKDDFSQTLHVMSKELLDYCMRITCSKPLYYFSNRAFHTSNGKGKIIKCVYGSNDCFEFRDSNTHVFKLRSSLHGKEIFVSSQELSINYDENQDFFYDTDYYKNEVICFQTNKIQGEVDPNVFQFTDKKISCSIINELKESTVKINVQGKFNCFNEITLHMSDARPVSDNTPFERTCQYLLNPDSQPTFVDPSSISVCIAKTCSKIIYVIDISTNQENVVYPAIPCEQSSTSQANCLQIAKSGAILKVASSNNDVFTFLYTKELSTEIPQNYFYNTFYGPNNLVCFNSERLSNMKNVKEAGIHLISTNQLCLLVKELSNTDIPTEVQIPILDGCTRTISLFPNDNMDDYQKSVLFARDCDYLLTSIDKIIPINSPSTLEKCIFQSCTFINYVIDMSSSSQRVTYPVTTCTRDQNSQNQCLEIAIKGAILKVSTPRPDGVRYLYTTELNDDIPSELYYSFFYGPNQIVCFNKNKFLNYDTVKNAGISIIGNNKICVLVDELKDRESKMEVEFKVFGSCNRRIILSPADTTGAQEEANKFERKCQYLLKSDNIITYVNPTVSELADCITKSCIQIIFVVDLSAVEESVTYDVKTCMDTAESQKNCLDIGNKGAIMKVSTPSPSKLQLLYTKNLTSTIPEAFYYNQFYGPNLIVCFDKNRIFNIEDVKAAVLSIEYTHDLCILNDEIKSEKTDMIVQLKIDERCKRSISISSASSSSSETLSNEIDTKCNRFIIASDIKSEIIKENIKEVEECITSLCLKVVYLVKANDEVMDCEKSDCDVTQTEINFFKIYSVYNDKSFYIIPKDTYKNEIMVSNSSRYYQSSYYPSDIVCYKNAFLSKVDTDSNSGYIIYDDNSKCFIPKDLSQTTKITLQIPNGCKRMFTLHNTQRAQISQSDDTSFNYICRNFNVVNNSPLPISISLQHLKQCVLHLCLQPIFIVKYQQSHDKYAAIRQECNANSQQCVSEAESFDYVKLQNLYTEEYFYVINSEPRELEIPNDYFYPSPFYNSEVICIEETRIPTLLQDLKISNSYNLVKIKCVILKELDIKNTFQIVTNKCTRDISIISTDSGDLKYERSVVSANCKELASNSVIPRKVHNMTNDNLKKCVAETCSRIISRVILLKDKPLIDSTIESCTSQSDECLINNGLYDFIKIESTMFEGSRYFRNFDSSLVSQYTAKTTEIYDSQYTEGDIVCFKAKDVIGPDGWLELPGVFIEPPRICIIPQELQNDIYIYIYLEYKITSEYYQNISIKKSSHKEGEIKSTAKTECPHFFDQSNPQLLSYESNKNELLSCIQHTNSYVYFLVEIKSNEEAYVHKKLRMCNKHTNVSLCFNEIDVFDSVKVKSPFRTDSFYVRSMGLQKPTLEIFKNYFYQQTYYPDDFVCFHDLLSSQDRLTQTGILISSSASCLVVRDLTNTPSITIKMFDKCSKNIEFSTKEFKSPTKIEINCSLFYNSITDATNIATTMSISDLRTCIELTCSKISSVYVNSKNGDVFKKTMKNCNGEPEYGDATCLKDLDHYYLAKIQRGVDDAIIYLQEESVHNFDESLYDPYFYSSKYFNNEVVCVNRKNLEPESKLVLIQTGNANLVCLIIKDLEISTLKLKTSNNCKKEIVLDRINPRPEIEELFQDNCKFFYSNPNKEDNILEMGVEGFKQCIAKTCSKIISYIKRNDKTTTYTIDNITLCSGQYGDSDCVVGEHYDFAVIENSYLSYPAIVRSIDFDAIQPQKISHIFQRSVYYNTEIVCLASKMILNLQLIVNQAGVYSKTQRTCIIGSQISTDVTLELSVNGKCNQTLFVTSSSKSESKHPTLKLDEDCKAYYHHEQTLLVQSYDTIIKCVAHTCASVEFMNQTIIDHGNDDKCDKSSTGCQDQNEFTYAFVNLISNPKPILVMSPETKNQWIKSFDDDDTHISNNIKDKIQCFKENSIDAPESITDSYVNHESNILCIDMKDSDTQVLMTNDNDDDDDSNPKISIIRSKDQTINDITSKEMKISIHADIQSTGKMLEIFKYNVTLDINQSENNVSSIDQLESCIMSKKNKLTGDHVHKPSVDDLYAFMIRSNIVFKSSLIFMKRNKSACAKYYSGIENVPINLKPINKKLHNFECLIVSRDTLTSNAEDYSPRNNLNKTDLCINREDIIKRCSKVYEYSNRIILCYKLKDDEEENDEDEIEEDDSPQPVEVMTLNGNCYISKMIRHDRVAMCNINEHGVSIQIVDFDLRIKEQVLKSVAAKIQNNLWAFGVSGIFLIALALLYSVSRTDNVDQYKLDGGNAYLMKMTTH